jgi:hypothetical protein
MTYSTSFLQKRVYTLVYEGETVNWTANLPLTHSWAAKPSNIAKTMRSMQVNHDCFRYCSSSAL